METPTPEANDVFSLSDHLLAERLQFVKEIGFGNWGSVWLCRPKSSSSSNKHKDVEVAVKLVHRSKTSTTAARVRSLWNEMKIVRSFKADPHPSIIPFHSFIITPSYALITMAYLPTLVPVEVSEPRAKEWFRSLLSGVHFLHERGVVHNDIKPANILLSHKNIPVLVDFGFAEKYDLSSPKAFHSNLAYGTPEYLSPERARGLPHDTRKSDMWSLGVTFFEILVGRTPFEYEEGEQFSSKADLEKYWGRTMRGKWVGSYTIPRPAEKLLKRMIVPNADLRCTAKQAMADIYWQAAAGTAVPDKHAHSKSRLYPRQEVHTYHCHREICLCCRFPREPDAHAYTFILIYIPPIERHLHSKRRRTQRRVCLAASRYFTSLVLQFSPSLPLLSIPFSLSHT
ncbi:kinase-like domain-containing protein [Suillus americanus]|nr:kinase-like domain-containing protein [Suillus americanus]